MSVEVVAWPPFAVTAWDIHDDFPRSRSVAVIQGTPRTSSALLPRRKVTASTRGIGMDRSGAGYVRMLNRRWAGKEQLVRMECYSALWRFSPSGRDLAARMLQWLMPSTPLLWSAGGVALLWGDDVAPLGVVATDGVWPAISVSGLPPNVIVARPSDLIEVNNGTTVSQARAMTVARSNSAGVALIRLETAVAFGGYVSIGVKETGVFEALEVPRGSQPLSGDWLYQWSLREVFAEEYVGGFTEVDPWR